MTSPLTPRFQLSDVEVVQRDSCFNGFLKIERLHVRVPLYQGGKSGVFQRELMLRDPGVGVLLYDPVNDSVLLVEQFRAGCLEDTSNGPWALELVAGMVDSGESEEAVARREAVEEAGVVVGQLIKIGAYYNSPGGSNEKLSVYCGNFDAQQHCAGYFGLSDENEDIRTIIVSRTEALLALASGRINNAMSIIALQWLALNLSAVKAQFMKR
jgi:ADP-ribose pyrophosphatase